MQLSYKRAHELLTYDPETGKFHWKVNRYRVRAGDETGCHDDRGYRKIKIDQRVYYASRLAVLMMTGKWPPNEVDHRNRDKSDDRWENLRPATRQQNCANQIRRNKTGFKGVRRHQDYHSVLYAAIISANGKTRSLGYFKTPEEAHAAYRKAAEALFREFAAY